MGLPKGRSLPPSSRTRHLGLGGCGFDTLRELQKTGEKITQPNWVQSFAHAHRKDSLAKGKGVDLDLEDGGFGLGPEEERLEEAGVDVQCQWERLGEQVLVLERVYRREGHGREGGPVDVQSKIDNG